MPSTVDGGPSKDMKTTIDMSSMGNNPFSGEGEAAGSRFTVQLEGLARLCAAFRSNDGDGEAGEDYLPRPSQSADRLIEAVRQLVFLTGETPFSTGLRELGIPELPEIPRARFYCLCGLFYSEPMKPVERAQFWSDASAKVFAGGIGELLARGLVTAVAVNEKDEGSVRKDRYLLDPSACGILFKGLESLVSPAVVAQFGTMVRSGEIAARDLVFPDSLEERLLLISSAVSRERFPRVRDGLKARGFRTGLAFLLAGPPGTGKTEFVRQLARREGRNILMVDAAKLDGTYFGEKPRNIRDLFRLTKYISALMLNEPFVFIDEADGLLGRRVEAARAADKEENTTVNIILEEMNSFQGILFAATNNLGSVDPAMGRRFVLKAVFPVPDTSVRARIWQARLPFLAQREAWTLAERFPLSGGLIDNVASLCLVQEIVEGRHPSYAEVVRNCESQLEGMPRAAPKIGF